MSKNTANVTVKYSNQIIEVASPTLGIAFVVAKTPRGSVQLPANIISSIGQLALYFGDDDANYTQMPYIKDILNEGGKVRISRILGAGAIASLAAIVKGSDTFFTLSSKYKGLFGNSISVAISAASDGNAAHFNMTITDSVSEQVENYVNIDPSASIGQSTGFTYLDAVIDNSTMVNVAYADLTTVTGIPDITGASPIPLATGTDGAALATADFTTGCTAFDDLSDAFLMCFPGEDDDSGGDLAGIDAVGMSYATNREDLMYIGNIPESKATQSTIVTFLQSMGSSRYTAFVGGGLKVVEGRDTVNTLTHAAVVGHMCKAQGVKGVWNSPAGTQAGTLSTGVGVVNNFAAVSKFNELNAIANAGGDMVLHKNGLTFLKDGYTMSQDSVDKFISVVMTDIYLRKLLVPVFENNLNKPNFPQTWADIYYACTPYLDQMVQDGAILSYTYNGDQFANSPADYEVNLPADVALGKYKVKLMIVTVSPMVEVELTIIKTLEGVTTS